MTGVLNPRVKEAYTKACNEEKALMDAGKKGVEYLKVRGRRIKIENSMMITELREAISIYQSIFEIARNPNRPMVY